ncbi:MAG: winged helix-turn-helix domain-containing protein [Dehalococcoidia bacterium]
MVDEYLKCMIELWTNPVASFHGKYVNFDNMSIPSVRRSSRTADPRRGGPRPFRQHARIERGDSGCLLVDLGSSNGTYHNGTRVEGEITLQPGDVITIADFMITCLGSSDATTRAYIPSPRAARAAPVESEGAADTLRVDAQLHQVWIGKEVLERQLSAQEFDLLRYLYEHADRVCSSEELSDAIWGAGNWDRNMLHRLVHRLKRKLEPNQEKPRYIQTVPWVGYRVTP